MNDYDDIFDFEFEVKGFSNKSSKDANPQMRTLSIIVSFNSLFQGTDYHYTNVKKIRSDKAFNTTVNSYLVAKKIPAKEAVVFPLYINFNGDVFSLRHYDKDKSPYLCGFAFYLKRDLRRKYGVIKITESVVDTLHQEFLLEISDYNKFLNDDVWLIVASKPHGRNFIVYGKDRIEDKLFEINNKFKEGV